MARRRRRGFKRRYKVRRRINKSGFITLRFIKEDELAPPDLEKNFIGQYNFSLKDVYANTKPVWDYYRIRKVVITFEPRYTVADTNANAAAKQVLGGCPYGSTVVDLDDTTLPTGTTGDPFLNWSSRKRWHGLRKHTRVFIPKPGFLLGTTSTTGNGFFAGRNNLWIDSNDTIVVHHGIKFYMENPKYGISWKVTKKYYVQFKGLIKVPATTQFDNANYNMSEDAAQKHMEEYSKPPKFGK
ncbi:putative cp [Circovirus gyurgyalag]|nr:putative cp [European bee-eater circovirus]